MTPRQRWQALLNGQRPDRVPTDIWATGEVFERLRRDLNAADQESLYQRLHIDATDFAWPRYRYPHHPDIPGADYWGVRYRRIAYGTGSYDEADHRPLADATCVADIHRFRWPHPDDFDYSPVQAMLDRDTGQRLLTAGWFEPLLMYGSMRGLEQSFEDLLLDPDLADAVLGHMFDFCYEWNRRILEAGQGRIELFRLAEDLGSQSGPLFSLETYRRFLLPHQVRMAELARSYGCKIFYHTDGAARVFLPDLIDKVGIDILNPLQWRCPGMELDGLVRDYGNRVIFHGGVDNQQTLAFGSVQDVIDEVKHHLDLFAHARWICAPCHNIQPVSPTANIVAMYETVHEFGSKV